MINEINLKDWKTKKNILAVLHSKGINVTEREWRRYVEEFNKGYYAGFQEQYIVHGAKGYKLTSDRKEILLSAADLRKRGINMLYKHSRTVKAADVKQSIRLELEELGIID